MTIRHDLPLAPRREFFACKLPERFQQMISRVIRAKIRRQKRLIYQRREDVEHLARGELVAPTNGCSRLECAAAGEDGEALEDPLFGFGKQIVAPVNRRA